jgi:hypothetical protein
VWSTVANVHEALVECLPGGEGRAAARRRQTSLGDSPLSIA